MRTNRDFELVYSRIHWTPPQGEYVNWLCNDVCGTVHHCYFRVICTLARNLKLNKSGVYTEKYRSAFLLDTVSLLAYSLRDFI